MMTQSINPQPSVIDPEEIMVREVTNKEDEQSKLKKQLQKTLSKKLSNLLLDAKKRKLGGNSGLRQDSKRSVFSKASQNSSKMLATEVSIASDINNLVKNKSIKKSVKQVQIDGVNLSQFNINQDSQANFDNSSDIELQTQNFQGTLLNLSKRTPTIGTRQSTRLAQPKDPIIYQKRTKFEGYGKPTDTHSFNPQNKLTLASTAQDFNQRKLSVQRPRQLAPIQNISKFNPEKSKFSSQRVSPISVSHLKNRFSPDNTNGQWSENLQFKFNSQQPTLKRIRNEQQDNRSFGVINFQDEIESCWEATHFSKKEIRQKKNKSGMGGYSNKNLFPFLIETGVIEEQVKFKAAYTKSKNLYQYEEDLGFWDNMNSQQFTKMTDNSIQAFEMHQIENARQSNNTTSRRDVTIGTAHIVSEQSEEESPLQKFTQKNKLKLQISKIPKQPYTQSINSPAKSPTKYDSSPGSGDYTYDSMGEKKLRNPDRNDSSVEREKYEQMVAVVNSRIKKRERGQVQFKNAIQKVKKKDVGFDLEYLDDKINKSLMSTQPKFIYTKYQSTLPPQEEKKVQSKLDMGSRTKGAIKRKKINFMARNTMMYSSNQLPQTKVQEFKKAQTNLDSQLENQLN